MINRPKFWPKGLLRSLEISPKIFVIVIIFYQNFPKKDPPKKVDFFFLGGGLFWKCRFQKLCFSMSFVFSILSQNDFENIIFLFGANF